MTKTRLQAIATTMTCPTCKRRFTPGVNGLRLTPGPGCDKCLGIVRDKTGAPWLPREVEHLVDNPNTGKPITVTREEALPNEAFKKAFPAKKG